MKCAWWWQAIVCIVWIVHKGAKVCELGVARQQCARLREL